MNAARLARLEELFHAALELEPAARAEFLDRECADDAVRAELEELLAADAGAARFLTPPSQHTLDAALADRSGGSGALEPGTRIGAYTVVRKLASGGMGTVYLAARSSGDFEQTVAVKVVTSPTDRGEVLERFKAERQTLARLNHPNISRLLDGGATENGSPYLVMEYIEGTPIDVHADEHGLSIDERLDLFQIVCAAVHYAHTNLVVHRDIKPMNVLVDARGAPKLLDFGIAKVLDPSLAAGDARSTLTHARMMTPEYASPEQVRGEPVTTATDVYSLGVVLYALLTGHRPYRLRTRLPHEIERAICEQEPERPSTVVTRPVAENGGETPEWIATQRATLPRRLRRRLAGDLDTIVLHALHKDAGRRYASVEQFAEDIRRHRSGMPIVARPDTWTYRTGKFVSRHAIGVATAALVVVVLLASAVSIARSARIARERLSAVLRLSDLTRLADLNRQADQLWPAAPEQVPALDAWLVSARELVSHLAVHRATLAELRAQALPYDDSARALDRTTHPSAGRLADLAVQREGALYRLSEGTGDATQLHDLLARIETEIAELSERSQSRRTWRFASTEQQWEHDKLAELVANIEELAAAGSGNVASVEKRLEVARTVNARTIDAAADAWRAARTSIASPSECAMYAGLALSPQPGLVPLGRDPLTGLWEFAHVQTGSVPVRGPDDTLEITEATGLVFVLIPGGSFAMGAQRPNTGESTGTDNIDTFARQDEAPVHEVALAPFFLSKYEMTQGQWLRFTGKNPSLYVPGQVHGEHTIDLTHPVEQVSHEECARVLWQLGLALPTEAQWEYAARAGTTTPWWTGSERDSLIGAANLADASAARVGAQWRGPPDWPDFDDSYVVHAPVHGFRPNAFGLHHVLGNVWEWCRDNFATYELPVRALDGERVMRGTEQRVGRGGSYMDPPNSARASHRGAATTSIRDKNIGVRPARALAR